MFPLPHVKALSANVMVLGVELWKLVKYRWGHEGGVLTIGLKPILEFRDLSRLSLGTHPFFP